LRVRFDTDAVKLARRPHRPQWPTLLGVAATKGCQIAWVLTYRGNPNAMALYKSAGGVEGVDDSGAANEIVGYSFDLAKISKYGQVPLARSLSWKPP